MTKQEVTKEQIDALALKLKFVYGKTSENRIVCTATLDGFPIADGDCVVIHSENFDEKQAIDTAVNRCKINSYHKLWELEGYKLSRSLNEGSSEKKSPVIFPKKEIIT